MTAVGDVPAQTIFHLTEYSSQPGTVEASYQRRELRTQDESPTLYRRRFGEQGHTEGAFVGRKIGRLGQYIAAQGEKEPAQYLPWPVSGEERWLGLLLEFDPPLVILPSTIRPGERFECRSTIRASDRWGHPLPSGTIQRTVRVEGFEAVAPGERMPTVCLRLVTETQLRFGWLVRANVTEYVWLGRGIGEVKVVRRIQMLAFLLYFDEAYVYELADPVRSSTPLDASAPALPASWTRVALLLDRFLPGLRIGGAVIEYGP
ncbi:MAG: hypothetical protein GY842_03655 [bacterium]|nr:hypothetical protein [bacterium]